MWAIIGGFFVTAGVVITPRILRASPGDGLDVVEAARIPEHQRTLDQLASVLGRSHRVLAWHAPTRVPVWDIALWTHDHENPGVMDADELAVISWSRSLQLLTYHTLPSLSSDEATAFMAMEFAGSRDDCRRLRHYEDAPTRQIARRLSDITLEPMEPTSADSARTPLRITLTWASDSVDGPDTAATIVDVATVGHRVGAAE